MERKEGHFKNRKRQREIERECVREKEGEIVFCVRYPANLGGVPHSTYS